MRISITDRCNLRCRYCMPAEGIEKVSMSRILTYEEILQVCRAAVSLGITRFKVTGGEPLVRRGCVSLIREMKRIPGVEQVTLTTNGQRLAEEIDALAEAGLDGINVSLDTLREDRYREVTGGGELKKTLAGLKAALDSGIPTKVNCLLQRGFNEDELPEFAALALGEAGERTALNLGGASERTARNLGDAGENLARNPVGEQAHTRLSPEEAGVDPARFKGKLDVRFIEIMPIGFGLPETGLSNKVVLKRLKALYPDLQEDARIHGNGPAVYYRRGGNAAGAMMSDSGKAAGTLMPSSAAVAAGGSIGLISAMHSSFCGGCNRIRLTSQGEIKPCLCYEDSISLIPALRPEQERQREAEENDGQRVERGLSREDALREALQAAILAKPAGHTFENRESVERRTMMAIGG